MTQLWQTVFAIIGSVGGAGVIIAASVKFSADFIANKLSQKYELKLNKELEEHKASLDKKTYISRSRFDMEFSIYGKLSEVFLSMEQAVYWLFPEGIDYLPIDEDERQKIYIERYKKANETITEATKVLGTNAPFIPADIFKAFDEIRRLCTRQYNMYNWCGPLSSRHEYSEAALKQENDCWERTREIADKENQLIDRLREYLEKLEVAEES